MKKNMLIVIAMVVIIAIGLTIKYGMEMKYDRDLREIRNSRDISLDSYNANKSLVESYLQIYQIVDEDTYQKVKNDMYNHFSKDLQNEIFPTIHFTGLALHTMTTEVVRCIGTNEDKGENTFLLEFNLQGINYNETISNLVTVERGIIKNVVKIK